MLLNPPIGDLLQQLGLAVQSKTALAPSLRELVVLRVAAKRCCEPERRAHRSRALGLGLSTSEIEAVDRGYFASFEPITSAVLTATDHILDHLPIPPGTLDAIEGLAGHRTIFDLLTLVAYYDLLCNFFTVFEIAD
ncbi:carboxymuconolactone decarboxylase family protein [Pseudarthrobacter oxydans]|uniref:carboxymuconolactone decarboxylase family protein n=1 Tax=Pseudarthrobacter oxydans TaxID=1671 RepID=UPI00380A6680